ncbi:MAG TPA: ABC transporter permease [Pyrinomonadaceae bacterium]|jgi:putative ABC transport system permease protein
MTTLWQDVRFGLRMMWKSPGFTIVALLALALGIGANTAIFSVVNTVLLRPLPYEQPERLVAVWEKDTKEGKDENVVAPANFSDWREQNQVFEAIAAYSPMSATLTGQNEPEHVEGAQISPGLFSVLRVRPMQGRAFLPDDEQFSGGPVMIVSHRLWQRRFGADPNLIGKTVSLEGESFTVVGIMPPDFKFFDDADIYLPLFLDSKIKAMRARHFLRVVARLKQGVTLDEARSNMEQIARQLQAQYPKTNDGLGVTIKGLHEDSVANLRPALLLLLGAVCFVLLIASANVINLQLARAAIRQREISIRIALGASRLRIFRQLLTESLMLSLFGGALGTLLALWGVDLLIALVGEKFPQVAETGIDRRVLFFTLGVSCLTGVIFGLAPALVTSKPDLNETLKDTGRSATESFRRNRLRSLLVISEVAFAVVLLVGAGLMIRTLARLRAVDPGFNSHNVLTFSLSPSETKYETRTQLAQLYQQIAGRIEKLPGVKSAAAVSTLPISGRSSTTALAFEGGSEPVGAAPEVGYLLVGPNYFGTMEIPLMKGRDFNGSDVEGATEVIIINEAMARRFWPNEDAIGKRIKLGPNPKSPWATIVGVVGNVRHEGLDTNERPEVYENYFQHSDSSMTMVVRTLDNPQRILPAVRTQVKEADADLPVYNVRVMDQVVLESVLIRRLSMLLLEIFAGLAIVLAAIGLYGVMAYSVTRRTHEIGIRMALGAQAPDVLRMIIGQGMTLALIGVAIGLGAAFVLTSLMSSLLYGVSATDPVTFILVSLLLATVAFVACFIPARRATRVDPLTALRYE